MGDIVGAILHAMGSQAVRQKRTHIELSLLNGFRLRANGKDSELPTCSQRLLAYLALAGRPTRAGVSGTLWPDVPEHQANGSLRTALWRVNRVLPGVILTDHLIMSLHEVVVVDVARLRSRIEAALLTGAPPNDTDLLSQELSGELLPGWYEDWLLLEREQLRLLRMHAVEVTGEQLREQGRFGAALHAAYAVIRDDPLRESAHRLAIQIHLDAGNFQDAARHACQYMTALEMEMGVGPSPAFLALTAPLVLPGIPTASTPATRIGPLKRTEIPHADTRVTPT